MKLTVARSQSRWWYRTEAEAWFLELPHAPAVAAADRPIRILLMAATVAGCAAAEPTLEREVAATELTRACIEAGGTYSDARARLLRRLCDPDAVRGRSPAQMHEDAALVRQISGRE